MVTMQLFVLPLLIVGVGGWYGVRRRSRATRGLRVHRYGLVLLGDLWLVLVAAAAPLGPHPGLLIALVLVNVGLISLIAADVFRMGIAGAARGTPGRGRYRPTRGNGGYRGYRGD